MRLDSKSLMDKLGVGHVPGPYETCPWSHYDSARGITCSAEVRVGPDGNEIEAEVQIMYDTPPAGKAAMEQPFYMKCEKQSDGLWKPGLLRLRGQPPAEPITNWEEKACRFFQSVVQELNMSNLPDIEELLDEAFYSRDRYADQQGGGGGQAPKIKAGQLLGMKSGGGGGF